MPSISTINSKSGLTTSNGTPISNGNNISKDMFLKILAAEMQNQDPFSDQDPTAYVTQLAQFSQMEQSINMNDMLEELLSVNNGLLINSAMSTASNLIGKEVDFYDYSSGTGVKNSGIVQSTYVEDGIVYLEVKLDSGETKSFSYGDLLKVSINKEESSLNETTTENNTENNVEEVL